MNPTEKAIRASWAINCAIAIGNFSKNAVVEEVIYKRAISMLSILDRVKTYIEPPLKETGKSAVERKEDAKNSAELSLSHEDENN